METKHSHDNMITHIHDLCIRSCLERILKSSATSSYYPWEGRPVFRNYGIKTFLKLLTRGWYSLTKSLACFLANNQPDVLSRGVLTLYIIKKKIIYLDIPGVVIRALCWNVCFRWHTKRGNVGIQTVKNTRIWLSRHCMDTNLWNVFLYLRAMRAALATSSGWSPLTWRTGHPTNFAKTISEQKWSDHRPGVDLETALVCRFFHADTQTNKPISLAYIDERPL